MFLVSVTGNAILDICCLSGYEYTETQDTLTSSLFFATIPSIRTAADYFRQGFAKPLL